MRKVNGSLENEILDAIWNLEDTNEDENISVTEVLDFLNENSKTSKRAYTTIKTVMDRLVDKQMLVRFKEGKKFYYKSTSSRNEMAQKAIKSLANQYFNNNLRSLINAIEKECSIAN